MRTLKLIVGLFLLPACALFTWVLYRLIWQIRPDVVTALPPDILGLFIGFFLWIILFLSLPRPVMTYVLGHELTHALWAVLLGGRVSRLKVSGKGGSVQVSKTNFVISLAPYFFPFYTVLVILVYAGLSLFVDQRVYRPFWMGCIGLSWSFHLTFTLLMLAHHQTDVQEHGRIFSYTFIYLANVIGLCLWVVAVGRPTLENLEQETTTAWKHGANWTWELVERSTR